uniref:Uncharacterized protein n=1 Tax=Solanum lycopersicum TaxID=4081 RepID=A0A3Q7FI56_SOLLC
MTIVEPTHPVDSLMYLSKHSLLSQRLLFYSLLPSFLYTPFHLHAFVPPKQLPQIQITSVALQPPTQQDLPR